MFKLLWDKFVDFVEKHDPFVPKEEDFPSYLSIIVDLTIDNGIEIRDKFFENLDNIFSKLDQYKPAHRLALESYMSSTTKEEQELAIKTIENSNAYLIRIANKDYTER